jgi:predicted GNAT family acetyltransferase
VPEAFEGKGVGGQLARAALAYAREHELKVIPTCPFIAAYITKHPEHHDLVHPNFRARLGIE